MFGSAPYLHKNECEKDGGWKICRETVKEKAIINREANTGLSRSLETKPYVEWGEITTYTILA